MRYEVDSFGELAFGDMSKLRDMVRHDGWPIYLDLMNQNRVTTALAALEQGEGEWHGAQGVNILTDKMGILKGIVEKSMEAAKTHKEENEQE